MRASRGPTLEEAIVSALAAGDDRRAIVLLRRAFGHAPEAEDTDLPSLLEELTEYYLSVERFEDAVAVAGRAVLLTPSSSSDDLLRRRCRIAEALLRAGLPDEACAIYAEHAAGDDTLLCVHEAAGADYLEAGDPELAFAWLTAGLERALAEDGDPDCGVRVLGLRRICLRELGMGPDALDRRAAEVLRSSEGDRAEAADDIIYLDRLEEDEEEGDVPAEEVIRLLHRLRESDLGGVAPPLDRRSGRWPHDPREMGRAALRGANADGGARP